MAYYIVKFVNSEGRASKYASVPESWVKIRRPTDNMAVVVYPSDDASSEARVRNNEKPAADWKQHLCEIVHVADDYCDAMIAAMQYDHEDSIADTAEESKGKPKSTELTSDASTSKMKYNDSLLDVSINELNESSAANTSKSIDDKTREGLFVTLLEKFLSQIQESGAELLNTLKEDRAPKRAKVTTYVPPEYDENDSRWTLRHPQMAPGLVELMDNTNVYVNESQLQRYTTIAPTSKYLTQTLMTLIFTDVALSFCTLSQKKYKLDSEAVNALLDYVKRAASDKGWPPVDVVAFNDWVRQKLQHTKRVLLP